MPFTVPWRFCGGGCRLGLGFGGPGGGVAAIQAAKLRRLREGFWFTAYLASLGLESLTVCHVGGRGQAARSPSVLRLHPTSTVGQPSTIMPPCAVISSIRACGILIVSTVNDPSTITSGGPTHTAMSPTRAAGKPPISTVTAPGGRIGPPT